MKKVLLYILVIGIVLSYSSTLLILPTYADDPENNELDTVYNVASYTCVYNAETDIVNVSGTMNYDMVVKYQDYSINLYKVKIFDSVENVIQRGEEPLAVSPMSIKFTFDVKISDTADKFAQYAIVVSSSQGESFLAGNPKYISIPELEITSKVEPFNYKGIRFDEGITAVDVKAGTVIIPVYLNKILSSVSKGYVYQDNYKQLYFDNGYIDSLDVSIKSATAMGAKVYLQLLLPVDANNMGFSAEIPSTAKYLMPNLENDDVLNLLDAFVLFVTERYDRFENGIVDGIIAGKNIDLQEMYNFCGNVSLEKYINIYSLYIITLGISARIANSDIDIVIPISATDLYSLSSNNTSVFKGSEILESVIEEIDSAFPSTLDFNILVENDGHHAVVERNEQNDKYEILTQENTPNINCASDISQYLKTLSKKYKNAPNEYIYLWNLPADLEGEELEFLYSYSYYTLMSNAGMISFVVSFENNNSFVDVKKLINFIDEKDSLLFTQPCLKSFGFDSWDKIINNFDSKNIVTHRRFQAEVIDFEPNKFNGEYVYYNVSDISDVNNWSAGNHCSGLSLDYNKLSGNSLKVNFSSSKNYNEYGEIFYIFDNPENFVYTPYINFNVFIESLNKISSVYEVRISLFGDKNYMESAVSVESDKLTPIALNIKEFSRSNTVRSIRISIKEISDDRSDFTFYLKDITGYSSEYSGEELEEFIYNEHMKGYNQDGDLEGNSGYKFILGMCFAFLGIGIGLFMFLKKD